MTARSANRWRCKFKRTCNVKPSGRLDVPADIHQQFMEKGASRDKLLETFIKSNGDKEQCLSKPCSSLLNFGILRSCENCFFIRTSS